jgi:hypothetical protein
LPRTTENLEALNEILVSVLRFSQHSSMYIKQFDLEIPVYDEIEIASMIYG